MMYDQYQGLIFDMDGTLLDTEPVHAHAWRTALAKHNINLTDDILITINGSPTTFIGAKLVEHFNMDIEPQQLVKEKIAIVEEILLSNSTTLPLVDIVKAYYGKKPMALGTGSNRYFVSKLLEHFGLTHYFDAIVTSDDVKHHKPAPDTFLKCAELIGIKPEHCVVFEDANFGVQAALAANMAVVDVRELYK